MAEIPRGCDYLSTPGPIRNGVARVVFELANSHVFFSPFRDYRPFDNFERVVDAVTDSNLSRETQNLLDEGLPSVGTDVNWRDLLPVVGETVRTNPYLVTTNTSILGSIYSGRSIARGGKFDFKFKNRLLNRRTEGSFTGVVLGSRSKLSRNDAHLSPAEEQTCVAAMVDGVFALHEGQNEGFGQSLFTRGQFEQVMTWIQPGIYNVVYKRKK